jgi:hypothetical protein
MQAPSVSALLLALGLVCALSNWANALEFDMIYMTKCILEELDENIIVLGEFEAIRNTDRVYVPVDVKVLTPLSCHLDQNSLDDD